MRDQRKPNHDLCRLAGAAVAVWFHLIIPSVAAEKQRDSSPITLNRCRIKLIDNVLLASDRAGILAFVEPEEGDSVTSGQQVAGLRDEVAVARLAITEKQAENDIEVRYAVKAAEVAEAEHEKAVEANRRVRGAVPEVEVRRLKLAAERSVLQIEQAKHQLEINRLNRDEASAELQTYRIVAPFDGTVTRVYKSRGEAVQQGDPILELASTRRVRVEGYVELADVWKVRPGARVEVQLAVPEVELEIEQATFEGRIVFVDVNVQPVTRQVRVWAEVSNREDILRAGLAARMTIHPGEVASAEPILQQHIQR